MISSDLGEVSPTRKSVEELKKQLQSQVGAVGVQK